MVSIQMVNDNYDIIHNVNVRAKYPKLYEEVLAQYSMCHSSWYTLSAEAHREHSLYKKDDTIGCEHA